LKLEYEPVFLFVDNKELCVSFFNLFVSFCRHFILFRIMVEE
jgi:hypothetical protein